MSTHPEPVPLLGSLGMPTGEPGTWWVAECTDCTDFDIPLPFPGEVERATWVLDHHAETGHRHITLWEQPR